MRIKEAVKSITYLKDNAAEVVRDAAERGASLIVTQNGEAKAVVMGVRQYREWRETLALLKIVALGEADAAAGRVAGLTEAFVRARRAIRRSTGDG
jgi:prevent-host-death family protein